MNAVQKDVEIVKLLYFSSCKGETALHFAARSGHARSRNAAASNGAKWDVRNSEEKTALPYAVGEGHVEVVKILIQNGADVNADIKEEDWSFLHTAAGHGYVDIVKVLIENGADVNACEQFNGTALAQAASMDVLRLRNS